MAKSKKVVANRVYFELVERKAELLDRLCDGRGAIKIDTNDIEEIDRIQVEWDKKKPDCTLEPYEEKAKK